MAVDDPATRHNPAHRPPGLSALCAAGIFILATVGSYAVFVSAVLLFPWQAFYIAVILRSLMAAGLMWLAEASLQQVVLRRPFRAAALVAGAGVAGAVAARIAVFAALALAVGCGVDSLSSLCALLLGCTVVRLAASAWCSARYEPRGGRYIVVAVLLAYAATVVANVVTFPASQAAMTLFGTYPGGRP